MKHSTRILRNIIIVFLIYGLILVFCTFLTGADKITLFHNEENVESLSVSWPVGHIEVGETIALSVSAKPDGADLSHMTYSLEYGSGAYSVDIDNDVIFVQFDDPGRYRLVFSCDGVRSNNPTITVVKSGSSREDSYYSSHSYSTDYPQNSPEPQIINDMVWIPNSGTKYHNNPNCSNMKNPQQVTLSEAQYMGYEPCSKCY